MDLKLRPICVEDFEVVWKWSLDATFCSFNGWERGRTAEVVYEWWQKCVTHVGPGFIRLGIECDGKLIGYADLANIRGDTAELGIAIGETTLWGRGLATEAARCLMAHAAMTLGIQTLMAETHETNRRSRNLLRKLGFHEVSRIGSEEYMGQRAGLIQYRLAFKSIRG